MHTLFVPLILAVAFVQPQDPKAPNPLTPRRGPFEPASVEATRLRAEILGAWQLTRGEIPDLGASSGGVAGYALFAEGYMSFEVHVQGNTGNGGSNDVFFQTGTHRWQINDRATLESYSLIGTHNTTEDEEYDFEPPGQRREYEVKIEGQRLVLERIDHTARYTFMRLGKLPYPGNGKPEVDFYGRPIKPKDAGEGEKPGSSGK